MKFDIISRTARKKDIGTIPISYIAVTKPCIVEFSLVAVKRLLKAGAVIMPDMTP